MIKLVNNQIEINVNSYPLNFINFYNIADITNYATYSGDVIDFNNLNDIKFLEFYSNNHYGKTKLILHLKNCKLHNSIDLAYIYISNFFNIKRLFINGKYIQTEEEFIIKSKEYNRKNKLNYLLS